MIFLCLNHVMIAELIIIDIYRSERLRGMTKERRKIEWSLDLEKMRVRAGQFVTEQMGAAPDAKTTILREPRAGAESCRVAVAFAVGSASVRALEAGSPNLIEARIRHIGELHFDVSGDAQRQISLRQKANLPSEKASAASKSKDLHWEIGLAQNLPLRLDLRGGVGDAKFDLGQLLIDSLEMTTGVGKAVLQLPGTGARLSANIHGGIGLTEVELPAGAWGDLRITAGVGMVHLRLAPGSAVRLETKPGLGAINLPPGLVRVGGGRSKRVWQTADFDDSNCPVAIAYRGGLGRFELSFVDCS